MQPIIGVLALQGAFERHERLLAASGAAAHQIRSPDDLGSVQGLVIPGGESTTMSLLLDSSGLDRALSDRLEAGLPVFGTCAGMILLATSVLDGRAGQHCLGVIDIDVRRNGYGRQLASFETELRLDDPQSRDPFHAIFIRAPRVERCGDRVEILARFGDDPVLVRSGNALAAAFHPELGDDTRVHQLFTRLVSEVS